MSSSSEKPVQEGGTDGMPLEQTNVFIPELTGAANVSPQPVRSGSSERQNCDTVWTLSGTTMKAYAAMRGLPDMEDPLMTWIASLETDKRVEGEVTMMGDIENSIKDRYEWKARGPATYDDEEAQRKAIFTYDRPIIEHFGLADLELTGALDTGKSDDIYLRSEDAADGWKNYAASDVSDDGEGDPADVWISPATFALWSEGTKRWDEYSDDKYRSTWEGQKTYEVPNERQRPSSPNTALPRQTKHRNAQILYDVEDGKQLSPVCSAYAKSIPSILWSPPPLNPSLPPAYSIHLFNRMDPELMRQVRINNTSPEPSWGVRTPPEPEEYGPAEVDAAIQRFWGLETTRNIIDSKKREVAHLVQAEEEANGEAERLRHEARRLKHENRKLADCFAEFRSVRDRRIMRQVQGQIRELGYMAKAKMAEIKVRVRERDELRRELDGHLEFQRGLLDLMGKDTPEEVFAMYPDIWEPEEIRKNRRNYS